MQRLKIAELLIQVEETTMAELCFWEQFKLWKH